VGTGEVVAEVLAEAVADELCVDVAVVARPHADVVSEASAIRERLAGPGVNRMPPGSALNLWVPCGIARS